MHPVGRDREETAPALCASRESAGDGVRLASLQKPVGGFDRREDSSRTGVPRQVLGEDHDEAR